MAIQTGLLALPLLLLAAGRFLPGPATWGFNHFAYLPGWAFVLWLAAAALLLIPRFQRRAAGWLAGPIPRLLFSPGGALLLAILGAGCFVLLRERSLFMGDGYLVGELVEKGMPFRAFDSLDYLLHFQAYKRLRAWGTEVSSFDLYRVGSVLAGFLAVWVWTRLCAGLPWEPWRRATALGLILLSGPAALFFGYVESYSFLFLFLTAFLLAGVRVLEGTGKLWVAAAFFGAGLAFHLTAVFSGPALLYLALAAPVRPARRRWLEVAGPPAALFAVAVLLHVAEGYNAQWFRREFLEAKNTRQLWIPLGGGRGLFSVYHWKDLANLALITAPASLAAVAASLPALRSRLGEPTVRFLSLQIASVALCSLLLDRKLGGARDWDLFAAHVAGLALLAAKLLPSTGDPTREAAAVPPAAPRPRSGRTSGPKTAARAAGAVKAPDRRVPLLLGVSALALAPWVLLLHLEPRSIERFVAVAADFPDFQRAYSYEEVGKYYRKADDLPKAEPLYELAVATNPTHARLRVLLGSIYFAQEKDSLAREQYEAAVRLDPRNHMAMEMLGKVYFRRENYGRAVEWFRQLVETQPRDASAWELLGFAAMRATRPEEALGALQTAMELDPSRHYGHEIGVSLLQLHRPQEAAEALRAAVRRSPDPRAHTRLALAYALLEMARAEPARGGRDRALWLDEAEREIRTVLAQGVEPEQAGDLLRELEHLKP